VEGRNKELDNEVLALRKAAEEGASQMRTLQNECRRKDQDVGREWLAAFVGGRGEGWGGLRVWG